MSGDAISASDVLAFKYEDLSAAAKEKIDAAKREGFAVTQIAGGRAVLSDGNQERVVDLLI